MALEQPHQNNNFNDQFLTETIPVGWPWRLLIFSAFVFALSLFSFFGLRFGYQNYLDGKSSELDRNLEALAKQVSLEEQDKFVNFYSKLVNLKKVLDDHPYPSAVFAMLEKNVVAGVYFNDLASKTVEENAELKGFASSFNSLAQQVAAFEELPGSESILVKDVGLVQGSNVVNFTLNINFQKGFLSKPI